ncbi:MAG: Phosphomethylpyrimidine kinase [Hyphomicrobiales bacterium]|nr:Phosphomethylpyrimidine kinase [Hyphomicrobiales bacterium]
MIPNVLSIAGSDPSGGAGIQADLKTFSALGCYGMAAITALTAQNTQGVTGVHVPPASFVADQIEAIFADITVAAVKIGMLANAEIVEAVAESLSRHKPPFIVLDPVLVATSGDSLGAPGVVDAMREHLFPLATLITPNLPEAARLADMPEATDLSGLEGLASRLHEVGARAVLVKGGHLTGDTADDVLFDGVALSHFSAPRIATRNTHGTGCTLSSAIAAHLARGMSLTDAIRASKAYLNAALEASDTLNVGRGQGPVHHFRWLWS